MCEECSTDGKTDVMLWLSGMTVDGLDRILGLCRTQWLSWTGHDGRPDVSTEEIVRLVQCEKSKRREMK